MFLRFCSPISANSASMLPRTWRKASYGDADAARLGQPFEPCGDVDAIAEEIVAVKDHVAEIDPDPELDAAVGRIDGVALCHRLLYRDGAAHRVDDAAELDQHAVAG